MNLVTCKVKGKVCIQAKWSNSGWSLSQFLGQEYFYSPWMVCQLLGTVSQSKMFYRRTVSTVFSGHYMQTISIFIWDRLGSFKLSRNFFSNFRLCYTFFWLVPYILFQWFALNNFPSVFANEDFCLLINQFSPQTCDHWCPCDIFNFFRLQ